MEVDISHRSQGLVDWADAFPSHMARWGIVAGGLNERSAGLCP